MFITKGELSKSSIVILNYKNFYFFINTIQKVGLLHIKS